MPWLRISSCSYTIRPITFRLNVYPKYPNPTRDRRGWERWYTTGYAYSHITGHEDTTITIRPSIGIRIWRDARITIYDYRNSGMAWQHPYTWFIGISNVSKTSLTGYHPGWSPEFACTGLSIYLISKQPDYIRLFVGICHSVTVPAIRFFSVAIALFLVASWSVTGWAESLHHKHEL